MPSENGAGQTGHNSKQQIKSIVERVERLEEEKAGIASDIRDVYAEAKSSGFDVKALRAIVRLRREDFDKRREHEAIVETYMLALGMLSDTPLGQSAIKRDMGHANTKVVITGGGQTVETTAGGLQRAAEFVNTPAGRRKIRELAADLPPPAKLADADTSNPPFLPGDDEPAIPVFL